MSDLGNIKCFYDIDLCRVEAQSDNDDFKLSTFNCELSPANAQCSIDCYTAKACGSDTSHFNCNAPNCACTGSGCSSLSTNNQDTAPPSTSSLGTTTTTPSENPSNSPSTNPSKSPSEIPSESPSSPSFQPSASPTMNPSTFPSKSATDIPTNQPSWNPSASQTKLPSESPSKMPTAFPFITNKQSFCISPFQPSLLPTMNPTSNPSKSPTDIPSNQPSMNCQHRQQKCCLNRHHQFLQPYPRKC